MNAEAALQVLRQALLLALLLSAPAVLAAAILALMISLLQAATRIQEPTVPFLVKLVAVSLVLIIGGLWMFGQLVGFSRALLESVPLWTR